MGCEWRSPHRRFRSASRKPILTRLEAGITGVRQQHGEVCCAGGCHTADVTHSAQRRGETTTRLSPDIPRSQFRSEIPINAAAMRRLHLMVFCLTCSQTLEITTEPSPTAEATRFTDPARTSPTAKMPG